MPLYEFRCQDCAKKFVVTETFKEHEKHREKCPKCGSRKTEQCFSTVNVKTSKKS